MMPYDLIINYKLCKYDAHGCKYYCLITTYVL